MNSILHRKYKQRKQYAKDIVKDSLQNFNAKLGLGVDNLLSEGGYASNRHITNNRHLLESMYRSSWIVGKVIDVLAEDMTKRQITLFSQGEEEKIDDILRSMRDLNIMASISKGLKLGNLFGGAIGVLLLEGEDLETPLDVSAIQVGSFKGIYIYDRWMVVPDLRDIVTEYGNDYGLPAYYNIVSSVPTENTRVHHSRVIRFIGIELPYWESLRELFWGASLVERLYDRILIYDSATFGGANLLLKSYLRILKVDRLRDVIASGGQAMEGMTAWLKTINQYQSNEGITLIDKSDEMETYNWSFSGMDRALVNFGEQLAGATSIPLVKLFGQPPGGFNSSGDVDLRNYYDKIFSDQNIKVRPPLDKIIPIITMSLFGQALQSGWNFDFKPLWQMTEPERAEVASLDVKNILDLVSNGVIDNQQALMELRNSSRLTNRFTFISDKDIGKQTSNTEQNKQAEEAIEGS